MRNMNFKTNIGRRYLSAFIDYGIVWIIIFLYIQVFGTQTGPGSFSISGPGALVPLVIWFAIIVCTEAFLGGTIGNSVVGLKVLSIANLRGEITISQAILRRILDPVDMAFGGLVAVLVIMYNPYKQRLGDLVANTVVIRNSDVAFMRG